MAKAIYLDTHQVSRPSPLAIERMIHIFREQWGSLSSSHAGAQELFFPIQRDLSRIKALLGAEDKEIFQPASSGPEAILSLFHSLYLTHVRSSGKNHFLTTEVEAGAIRTALSQLEPMGCSGKFLPVNAQGQLTRAAIESALSPRTALLSLSWANGLTGVIHPIADLIAACKERDVLVHIDATYTIGKLYFSFHDFDIDFLTFDGSLIHAPRGTGGLLSRTEQSFIPTPQGLSLAAVAPLAEALEQAEQRCDHMCTEIARLRDKLETGILTTCPEAQVLFQEAERLSNCSAIAFAGIHAEALLFSLSRAGLYAAIESGDGTRLPELLLACGFERQLAHSAISFSLSSETTEAQIDEALRIIASSVAKLRIQ